MIFILDCTTDSDCNGGICIPSGPSDNRRGGCACRYEDMEYGPFRNSPCAGSGKYKNIYNNRFKGVRCHFFLWKRKIIHK